MATKSKLEEEITMNSMMPKVEGALKKGDIKSPFHQTIKNTNSIFNNI